MTKRTYSFEEFCESVGELMPEFDRIVKQVCKDERIIEDVLHNSFLKIITDLKSGNVWTMHGEVPWPRFYTIIRNEAINLHRENSRRRETEFRPEEFEPPMAPTNTKWTKEEVMFAFRKLCDKCRTLLFLKDVERWSADKILGAIQPSGSPLSPLYNAEVRTVQRHIKECRETLVRILEKAQ